MEFMPRIMTLLDGKECSIDLISYDFAKKRIIYLNGPVEPMSSWAIVTQLRYLDSKSSDDIFLFINSPGGSVSDGLAIYDAIKALRADVVTVATGMAASMGAFLLASGAKGKRYVTPEADIMIHQPLGGVQGQATDISLVADQIQKTKAKIAKIMASQCGKTVKKITADMERDCWMDANKAVEYGIVDKVGYPEELMGW